MYEIRSAAAHEALPLQRQLRLSDCDPQTGRHLLEHLADRLGAFADGELVGLVRLLPLDEGEREDGSVSRMEGPFVLPGHESCTEALHARVVSRLTGKTRLWRYTPRKTPVGEYDINSITIISGVQAIRKRPGMYIGGVDAAAMREVLFETVSNTLDEHLAGHATHVDITHTDGTWSVTDDGRGIPVVPLDRDGRSPLELGMQELYCGDYRGTTRTHAHAGWRGLGLVVLSALSEQCTVEVERDGQRHRQDYARGLPTSFLHTIATTGQRGTTLRLRFDAEIFGEAVLTPDDLRPRLLELAGLNPGLTITLQGEALTSGGLLGLAEEAAGGPLSDVRHIEAEADGVSVRAVVGWCGTGSPVVRSYCNQSPTVEGGSHVEGALSALSDLPQPGMVLLLAVRLRDPAFGGRTRDRLNMPKITAIVEALVVTGPHAHPRPQPARLR